MAPAAAVSVGGGGTGSADGGDGGGGGTVCMHCSRTSTQLQLSRCLLSTGKAYVQLLVSAGKYRRHAVPAVAIAAPAAAAAAAAACTRALLEADDHGFSYYVGC